MSSFFFFFNDTATTEIYTLSLHDALPISREVGVTEPFAGPRGPVTLHEIGRARTLVLPQPDRKSTRLNSSHLVISYAVFCLKKKKVMRGSYTPHSSYSLPDPSQAPSQSIF